MENTQIATLDPLITEKLILHGDLSSLKPEEKVAYYGAICSRLGLDPATQPFKLIRLNGKEVLYAGRECGQQLSKLHHVSHHITGTEMRGDIYVVTCRATAGDRFTDSLGAVAVGALKGEALANAYMKCETKAKRRATFDLLGLGMLDETEVETIPTAKPAGQELFPTYTDAHYESTESLPEGHFTISKVEEKSGVKKNGDQWLRYGIFTNQGKTFGSFNSDIGEHAKLIAGTGVIVAIDFTSDGKYLTVVAMEEVKGIEELA